MKKVILLIFLLLGLGVGISYSQQPIRDSIKAGDSLNVYNIKGASGMFYGIIYLKNTSTAYDTVCIHKYTQMGILVRSGLVNLDSTGNVVDRIILPPDGKYHTYGINHIYPGNLYIFFRNTVWLSTRRIDYEINYYTQR